MRATTTEMRRCAVTLALSAAIASTSGCSDTPVPTMPAVSGKQLDVALSDIQRSGVDDEAEVVGGGLFGIRDKSNWKVCSHTPDAGQPVTGKPRLIVDRACKDGPEPSASASSSKTASVPVLPSSTESEAPTAVVVTAKGNREFAALLATTDPGSNSVEQFAKKYEGQTLEFDGNVCAMNPHGSYKTRFDLLLCAGDFSETSSSGPNFQFKDVNITSDLHLTGANVPDSIGVGQNLRITAKVEGFNSTQELFFLTPVETQSR